MIAVERLYLGDTDPNPSFTANADAWRTIGYNLDGLISTKTGTNHCKPTPSGKKSAIQTDGENGIDNSFGSNLVPIIGSLAPDPSKTISQSIHDDGTFTIMFRLKNLDSNANQTAINGSLLGGAKFESCAASSTTSCVPLDCKATPPPTDPNCSAPTWLGTDVWPVVPELLNSPPDLDSAKLQFPASYVADGTWVSGNQGDLNLTVSIQGFSLALNIAKAVITMKINGTGTSATATNGIIAGVIPTEALVEELRKVAGGFEQSLCEGPTFDGIADEIRATSDIMQDGSNGDPTLTCDGISIGIAFDGQAVQPGAVAKPATAPADPCAATDGGAKDAATGG